MTLERVLILLGFISVSFCISPTGYPTSIAYDARAFTINGTRQLLLSGSIHYPRSAPSEWPRILQLTKQAGIDVVQTYVFWNLHQPTGPSDWFFDGRANIWEFLNQCHNAGLFVNLRIGPYVCAEWTLGGIPVWVKNIRGVVFRDYNNEWMNAMGKFVSQFVLEALSRKVFAHQGGPVILAQIENEYGNIEGGFKNPHEYLLWAVQLAQNLTNVEPWIVCQQDDAPSVPNLVNTCNGFYCDNWLPGHFSTRKTPAAWTENWPGWFQNWGSPKPHRPVQDVAFAVARWVARGGTLMNYYMWQGGTTWGRFTGGPRLVTSYDYDVALNEYGIPHNPKYSHSAALHKVLRTYASAIVENPPDDGKQIADTVYVSVYGQLNPKNTTTCVAFLSNIGNSDSTVTWQGSSYTVPAWSVSILGGCSSTVSFNTARIQQQENSQLVKRVVHNNEQAWVWSWWQDSVGPWSNAPIVQSPTPLEQIQLTNDATDYLWYNAKLSSSSATSVDFVSNVNDFALVFVNSELQAILQNGNQVKASIKVPQGSYFLNVLSQTIGLQNYGAHYESIVDGIAGGSVTVGGKQVSGWNHVVGLLGESYQLWTEQGVNKVSWNSDTSKGTGVPVTWWKTSFPTPSGTSPLALDITGLEKGYAYINGEGLGRYWNIIARGNCPLCSSVDSQCDYRGTFNPGKCDCDCGIPSQRYYHIPRDWLKPSGGINNLVIFEELGAKDLSTVKLVSMQ